MTLLYKTLVLFLSLYDVHAKATIHVMHISLPNFASSDLRYNVDYAFEIFNNDSSKSLDFDIKAVHGIMKGYQSRQEVGSVVREFIDLISTEPKKVAILGPVFSNQAQVVAEVAKFYNLVQVGYTTTAPYFTNKELYPLFARTIETTLLHNDAIMNLLPLFNWTRVAKIVPDSNFVVASAKDLQMKLDDNNVTTLASTSYSGVISNQVKQIKDSGARIIFAFGLDDVDQLLCKMHHQKMYGPRYQWLYWSGRHGLKTDILNMSMNTQDKCTIDMIVKAAEGMIYFTPFASQYGVPDNIPCINKQTNTELIGKYKEFLQGKDSPEGSGIQGNAFDAAWSVAQAINNTINNLGVNSLAQFNYSDSVTSRALYKQLIDVRFHGMTGDISFDKKGDRNFKVVIGQIRGGEKVGVALYDPTTEEINLIDGQQFVFPGGRPAFDHEVVRILGITASFSLFAVMSFLACLGVLMCAGSVAFNLYYHDIKLIKLSSPRVNSFVAFECALSYTAIILFGVDSVLLSTQNWLCQARVAVLVLGFTCAFGSMFSKTWRVHVLFRNNKLKKKVVKDIHLLGLVMGVLMIDCILLACWALADPLHWEVVSLDRQFDISNLEVTIQPQVKICTSAYISYWAGVMYVFKALLLLFGIFFAWETRRVQIEALNDSKHIGMCVYNVVIMSALTVPLVNLLSISQVSIIYGITSISIFVCSTTTLIFVFGLKMHALWIGGSKVGDVSITPFASSLRANTVSRSMVQPGGNSLHVPRETNERSVNDTSVVF